MLKINFTRIITDGNFEQANLEITCSTFAYSSLFVPWSVTLAGIPRACAKSELHNCDKKIQN